MEQLKQKKKHGAAFWILVPIAALITLMLLAVLVCFVLFLPSEPGNAGAGSSVIEDASASVSAAPPVEAAPAAVMPDVVNSPEQEAKAALEALGAVVTVEREYSGEVAEGLMFRTDATVGQTLNKGDRVTLYISLGQAPVQLEPLKLNRASMTLTAGEKKTLRATGGDGAYQWKVNNTKVATVKNGTVTAVGEGKTTITVISAGLKETCIVTVKSSQTSAAQPTKPQPEKQPEADKPYISLSDSKVTVKVGKSVLVGVQSVPSANFVTWRSSDKAVATVNSTGRITGVAPGKATIIVELTFGRETYSKRCEVTVTAG